MLCTNSYIHGALKVLGSRHTHKNLPVTGLTDSHDKGSLQRNMATGTLAHDGSAGTSARLPFCYSEQISSLCRDLKLLFQTICCKLAVFTFKTNSIC